MKKKISLAILGMIMLFSMFSIVSAEPKPTVVNSGPEGLQIFYPSFDEVKKDSQFSLHVHVSNISNGFPLLNTQADCFLHLYNSSGSHTFESGPLKKDSNGWDHEIFLDSNGGNFSDLGEHAFYIWCNNTAWSLGGEARGTFTVTPTGYELTIPQAVTYGFIILLLGLFLYFTIYGIRNAISAEWLIGYVCLTYVVLYLIISVLWILAKSYLWAQPMLEGILFMAWFIMGIGFLPFIMVISMVILGKEAKAVLEQKYIKQGYSPEEARDLSRKNKR